MPLANLFKRTRKDANKPQQTVPEASKNENNSKSEVVLEKSVLEKENKTEIKREKGIESSATEVKDLKGVASDDDVKDTPLTEQLIEPETSQFNDGNPEADEQKPTGVKSSTNDGTDTLEEATTEKGNPESIDETGSKESESVGSKQTNSSRLADHAVDSSLNEQLTELINSESNSVTTTDKLGSVHPKQSDATDVVKQVLIDTKNSESKGESGSGILEPIEQKQSKTTDISGSDVKIPVKEAFREAKDSESRADEASNEKSEPVESKPTDSSVEAEAVPHIHENQNISVIDSFSVPSAKTDCGVLVNEVLNEKYDSENETNPDCLTNSIVSDHQEKVANSDTTLEITKVNDPENTQREIDGGAETENRPIVESVLESNASLKQYGTSDDSNVAVENETKSLDDQTSALQFLEDSNHENKLVPNTDVASNDGPLPISSGNAEDLIPECHQIQTFPSLNEENIPSDSPPTQETGNDQGSVTENVFENKVVCPENVIGLDAAEINKSEGEVIEMTVKHEVESQIENSLEDSPILIIDVADDNKEKSNKPISEKDCLKERTSLSAISSVGESNRPCLLQEATKTAQVCSNIDDTSRTTGEIISINRTILTTGSNIEDSAGNTDAMPNGILEETESSETQSATNNFVEGISEVQQADNNHAKNVNKTGSTLCLSPEVVEFACKSKTDKDCSLEANVLSSASNVQENNSLSDVKIAAETTDVCEDSGTRTFQAESIEEDIFTTEEVQLTSIDQKNEKEPVGHFKETISDEALSTAKTSAEEIPQNDQTQLEKQVKGGDEQIENFEEPLEQEDSNPIVAEDDFGCGLSQQSESTPRTDIQSWKVGYLHVKLPAKSRKAKLKAWKKRWIVVQADEFTSDAKNSYLVLSIYHSESGNSRKHNAAFWKSVSSKTAVVYRSMSRTHPYAFTIAEGNDPIVFLSAESESSSQEWIAAIRAILWPPSPVLQLEKVLNGNEFDVSIIDNDFSFRAGLLGTYGYMSVTSTKLILCHPQLGHVIQEWYLNTVEKFHILAQEKEEDVNKVIVMHTSSDSSTGLGEIKIFCNEAVDFLKSVASTIHKVLQYYSKGRNECYRKELDDLADWLTPQPSPNISRTTDAEDYYKVPPRQVRSLLDIPNFIFDLPTKTVIVGDAISGKSLTAGNSPASQLKPSTTCVSTFSQDSGISMTTTSDDMLNCSAASFSIGSRSIRSHERLSSTSESSDGYTPPPSPKIEKRASAGNVGQES